MILKSYQVENDFNAIHNKIALFYGENLGLQNEFKETIKKINKQNKILNIDQEEILNSSQYLFDELNNQSLFEDIKDNNKFSDDTFDFTYYKNRSITFSRRKFKNQKKEKLDTEVKPGFIKKRYGDFVVKFK